MGDQKSTISVEGDVADATGAINRLKTVLAELERQAEKTGEELEGVEGNAADAAKARTEAAKALEFEVAKMKEVGKAQAEIAKVSRAALELRIEAAKVAGKTAQATKLTRQLELDGIKAAEAAKRQDAAATLKARTEAAKAGQAAERQGAAEAAKARADAAKARTEAAKALEFEVAKMKEVGKAQAEIAKVSRAALELRIEAAKVAGKTAQATKLTRQLELDGIKAAEAAKRQDAEGVKVSRKALELRIEAAKIAGKTAEATKLAQRIELDGIKRVQAAKRQGAAATATEKKEELAQVKRIAAMETKAKRARSEVQGLVVSGKSAIASLKDIGLLGLGFSTIASGAREAFEAVDKLATDSLEAQRAAVGLQVSIGGARQAFGGYVSDIDLAKNANLAFSLGVVETGEELAGLARGVQAKALELGKDSTQLFENAVTAIGRGSALILDNLGIILTQAEAQEIYAASLGKTVKQLTAFEKSQAFGKAALIEITAAGEEATGAIDSVAAAWAQGKIDVENIRSGILGFDDSMGVLNETVRGFPIEVIEELAGGGSGLGAIRDNQDKVNISTSDWLEMLNDAAGVTNDLGKDQASRESATKRSNTLATAARREAKRFRAKEADEIKATAEAENAFVIDLLNKEAAALDHQVAMAEVRNAKQSEIVPLQLQSLGLRQQAAEAAGEEAQALALSREMELATARASAPRGGGRRASDAEKTRAANEGLTEEMTDQLRIAELQAELAGEEASFGKQRAALARQELETELAVIEVTRTKGAMERVQLENRAAELSRAGEIIDLEARVEAQTEARDAEIKIAEDRIVGMDREIERLEALGVATRILQEQRRGAEAEIAELFGTRAEREELAHVQEIERIEIARADEAEAVERQLAAFERDVELATARGEVVREEGDRRLALELEIARVEGDADKRRQLLHGREVARIKERVKRQRAALGASNSLLSQGAAASQAVIGAVIRDEKKREKAILRARGIAAVARGGLELVESVASFAGFNFLQGALHAAAAAVAFATGFPMIAGREPSKGGGSGGGGGGGRATPSFAGGAQTQQRDLPSTPASAEELTRIRGRGATQTQDAETGPRGGVTQIFNNSTLVSTDTGTSLSDLQERGEPQAWGASA